MKQLTIKTEIGWDEYGEELFFDFPAIREPQECYECRGEGKTVADRLKGLDFSPEELMRNGDWDDYVEHTGIWEWHRCSRCSGHGCYMDTHIDSEKCQREHSTEWEMMIEHQNDKDECERESRITLWGESGGTCGSPY